MKLQAKKVDIVVSEKSVKTDVVKIIKRVSNEKNSSILENIKTKKPVYSDKLLPEKFYGGVKSIVEILNAFDLNSVEYTILINDQKSSKHDLLTIKQQVDNISLSDFR